MLRGVTFKINPKAGLDAHNGFAILSMTANLMSQVEPEKLVRVTVEGNLGEKAFDVDSAIGRTAHICYLDNPVVVEHLVYNLYPFLLQ